MECRTPLFPDLNPGVDNAEKERLEGVISPVVIKLASVHPETHILSRRRRG